VLDRSHAARRAFAAFYSPSSRPGKGGSNRPNAFAYSTPIRLDALLLRIAFSGKPVALDSVRITAAQDATRKSYYIDADAISASHMPVTDALDVLARLQPDMLKSRAPEICAGISRKMTFGRCRKRMDSNSLELARPTSSWMAPMTDTRIEASLGRRLTWGVM
jgi:hypothetical protein